MQGCQLFQHNRNFFVRSIINELFGQNKLEVTTQMAKEKEIYYPVLPLRGLLVYPTMILHVDVGRERSIDALNEAMIREEKLFLSVQRDMTLEKPEMSDLYDVGIIAKVKQMVKLPNGTMRVLVEGLQRAIWDDFNRLDTFDEVSVTAFIEPEKADQEDEALMRTLVHNFEKYSKSSKSVSEETFNSVTDIEEPGRLADMVASHLPLKISGKQEILEIMDVKERLEWLIARLYNEQEILDLEKKINTRVKHAMERTQKEFYLREQMKAIQTELGDKEGKTGEVAELKKRIDEAGLPEVTKKMC